MLIHRPEKRELLPFALLILIGEVAFSRTLHGLRWHLTLQALPSGCRQATRRPTGVCLVPRSLLLTSLPRRHSLQLLPHRMGLAESQPEKYYVFACWNKTGSLSGVFREHERRVGSGNGHSFPSE